MQQAEPALLHHTACEFSVVHLHRDARLARIPQCDPQLKIRNLRDSGGFRIDTQEKMRVAKSESQFAQDTPAPVHGPAPRVGRIQTRAEPLEIARFPTVDRYLQMRFGRLASTVLGRLL